MQQDSVRNGVGSSQPKSKGDIREYMKSREVYQSDSIAICVDAFYHGKHYLDYCRSITGNESFISLFFLSHLHSDHYSGINHSWRYGTIYASRPTANMLCWKLGVEESFVKPLEFGFTYVFSLESGKLLYKDKESDHIIGNTENEHELNSCWGHEESVEKCFSVNAIHANHCPGAAMFVFRSSVFGNIVHTGDFRFSVGKQFIDGELPIHRPIWEFSISNSRVLTSIAGLVDVLFLDNTFCDPRFDFPSQAESIHAVNQATLSMFNALGSEAKQEGVSVAVLIGTYSIGKERIALSLQETFPPVVKTNGAGDHNSFVPIYVSQDRYDSLKRMGYFVERFTPLTQCEGDREEAEVVGHETHHVRLPSQPASVVRNLFSSSPSSASDNESLNAEVVCHKLTIFMVPMFLMTYPELVAACKRQYATKRSRESSERDARNSKDNVNGDMDAFFPSAPKEPLPLWGNKVLDLARFDGVLCVSPTGWAKKAKQQKISERVSLLQVPYSEHCSFSEMVDFVSFINPSRVVPTVSVELFKKYEPFFVDKAPRLRPRYSNTQPLNRFFKPKTEISTDEKPEGIVKATTAGTVQKNINSVDAHKQLNPFTTTVTKCTTLGDMSEMVNSCPISTSAVDNSFVHIRPVSKIGDGQLSTSYISDNDSKQSAVDTKKGNQTSGGSLQGWLKSSGDGDAKNDMVNVDDDDDCVIVQVNPSVIHISDSSDVDDNKSDEVYK